MLKYKNYLKENLDMEQTFEKGDKVIYYPSPTKIYHKDLKGKEFIVTYVYPDGKNYVILSNLKKTAITASADELKKLDENQKELTNSSEEDATKNSTKIDISVGTRVSVTGKIGKIEYTGQKGTVRKDSEFSCLIDFDDDDSKNQRGNSALIDKKFITPLDEPTVKIFKIGDKVECVNRNSEFYKKIGEVEMVFEDGEATIVFTDPNIGETHIVMKPEEIKVIEYAKAETIGFKRTISVSDGDSKIKVEKSVEEEEDDDEEVSVTTATFKKQDLLEFSYTDFLLKEKTSTKETVLANKKKYEDALKDPNLYEFKKIFLERSLRTAEIIEQYFDFLVHKVAKEEVPVYRTTEQIKNEDLLRTKTKIRASESKEITRKYSFDQGIIAYWKFKDAVVFKTI
jgi:hypothetical protein